MTGYWLSKIDPRHTAIVRLITAQTRMLKTVDNWDIFPALCNSNLRGRSMSCSKTRESAENGFGKKHLPYRAM